MPDTILVTYATRSGSTAGVADAIGQALTDNGHPVEVLPVQDVQDLSPYRAVIAGSAIYMDGWLPEAMKFLKRHQAELAQKPFAAFLVCIALAVQGDSRRAKAQRDAEGYMKPVRKLVPPISEGLFAGELDLGKQPLIYRVIFRPIMWYRNLKQGDYRDWDAIRSWADDLSL